MGDVADDCYDMAFIQYDEQYNAFDRLSDKNLKKSVQEVLGHDYYKQNNYTDMIKDIVKNDTFTDKQRKALIVHIIKFYEQDLLWA